MASDPTTWAELEASLDEWTESDFASARLREFIALAERRMQRDVTSPERVITADLTIDAESESLPTDLWGIKALYLNTDPKAILEPMTLAELRNTYNSSATGKPQNYALAGETIVFGPSPDTTYTGKLTYIQTIPALGSLQSTNWLLTDHPDLYIAASLMEAFSFDLDEARAGYWEGRYQGKLDDVNKSGIRRTQGSAPIRIRSPVVV